MRWFSTSGRGLWYVRCGEMPDQPMYSIGAVASLLAVPASTLRAWEERYSVVAPQRSAGSHRLYSQRQVEELRFVKAQIERGLSAADAHRLLARRLEAGPFVMVEAVEAPPVERPLVLIAERDPYAARLSEQLLRAEGYDVVTALDAGHARQAFQARSPRAVIVDLLISGGAGIRLCRELSAAGAHVLAVSVLASADVARRAGARAFLAKPLDPHHLLVAIREVLGAASSRRVALTT